MYNEKTLETDNKIINKKLSFKFEHKKNHFEHYTQINFNIEN
jgi:hypothetical protein